MRPIRKRCVHQKRLIPEAATYITKRPLRATILMTALLLSLKKQGKGLSKSRFL